MTLSFRHVAMIRHAISPRFAISTFWIFGRPLLSRGGCATKRGWRRGWAEALFPLVLLSWRTVILRHGVVEPLVVARNAWWAGRLASTAQFYCWSIASFLLPVPWLLQIPR